MFPTGSKEIQQRIDAIDPDKYSRTRNYLNGSVTYLSPYISRGVISTKQVLHSVLSKGYDKWKLEKFVQELAWREFFQRVWQQKGEKIFEDIKEPVRKFTRSGIPKNILGACTGLHAIDRGINGLYENGYMHNHCRMYVASLICNVAKVHWENSARWMYYHLLDGDLASNMLSWQWVAGTFSKKGYFCNQENINRYTGTEQRNTYLDKSYEEIFDMEIPDSLSSLNEEPFTTNLPFTPFPGIDKNLPTLIYTTYNLDPLWYKGIRANRVLLLEPEHFKKFAISEKVLNFIIRLAKEIEGMQVYCGSFADLKIEDAIFKEHPLVGHFKGKTESRDWLFPEPDYEVTSFFSFWKKSEKYWKRF